MPSHFKFKEYCPIVFRNLRERFNVDEDNFMVNTTFFPGQRMCTGEANLFEKNPLTSLLFTYACNYLYLFSCRILWRRWRRWTWILQDVVAPGSSRHLTNCLLSKQFSVKKSPKCTAYSRTITRYSEVPLSFQGERSSFFHAPLC